MRMQDRMGLAVAVGAGRLAWARHKPPRVRPSPPPTRMKRRRVNSATGSAGEWRQWGIEVPPCKDLRWVAADYSLSPSARAMQGRAQLSWQNLHFPHTA